MHRRILLKNAVVMNAAFASKAEMTSFKTFTFNPKSKNKKKLF